MIVRNDVTQPSNWRQDSHLHCWLKQHGLPGISGVDTRALTRTIRDNGAPKGVLCHRADGQFDLTALQKLVADWPGLKGMDLASVVSTKKISPGRPAALILKQTARLTAKKAFMLWRWILAASKISFAVYDAGCIVDVYRPVPVPNILARKPDGIFNANGLAIRPQQLNLLSLKSKLIDSNVPIFGICIGHQLLALAMKHQQNGTRPSRGYHPVRDLTTGQIEITSQNHGFCVDPDSLPENVEISHISLLTGLLKGCGIKTSRSLCAISPRSFARTT